MFRVLKRSFAELKPVLTSLDSRPSRVQELADQIVQLNLLDTSDLVKLLKAKLNLPDVIPTFAQPPTASTIATVSEPIVEAATKSEYKVTLEKFDAAGKAKIIREMKIILPNLNLVDAKNFVEGAPKLIKEKLKKEEAEKIKKTLEDLGATVKME